MNPISIIISINSLKKQNHNHQSRPKVSWLMVRFSYFSFCFCLHSLIRKNFSFLLAQHEKANSLSLPLADIKTLLRKKRREKTHFLWKLFFTTTSHPPPTKQQQKLQNSRGKQFSLLFSWHSSVIFKVPWNILCLSCITITILFSPKRLKWLNVVDKGWKIFFLFRFAQVDRKSQ